MWLLQGFVPPAVGRGERGDVLRGPMVGRGAMLLCCAVLKSSVELEVG